MKEIKISAPGRICLFGEHQDYLQLPVITAAIDLRVEITATPRTDKSFHIYLPNIGKQEIIFFPNDNELEYNKERDYFKSVYNVLFRQGVRWLHGWDCTIYGKIPINSGTSSSSALNNVWCKFLLEAGENVKPGWKESQQVGHFSYLAEVVEFNEPGGKMDQLSTAIGGVLHIDFAANDKTEKLPADLGSFVLGDSRQPKDTLKILNKTKFPALSAAAKIKRIFPEFNFSKFTLFDLQNYGEILTTQETIVLQGVLKNRDICREAKQLMQSENIDHELIGSLLTEHHKYLRDNLQISTPKIEKMLKAAVNAGALGGKINGSGGGGCMFAYAPDNPHKVANAIEKAGGKAYAVSISRGLNIEQKRITD